MYFVGAWALALAFAGAAIGEFTGLGGGLPAIAEAFSPIRNQIALGYAAVGAIIGVIVGGSRYERRKKGR